MEYIEHGFDEEKQPQHNDLEMEYVEDKKEQPQHNDLQMENREHIFDEEGQPQNENISFHNNQIGYMTTDHKMLYLLIIRSTEGTINQERSEQESENESRVEVTTLEALVYLVYCYLNHLLYIHIDHMIIMDYLIMETISALKKTHMIIS